MHFFPLVKKLSFIKIEVLLSISFLISLISILYSYKSDLFFISDKTFIGNWIFYFIFGIFAYKIKIIQQKIISIILILCFIIIINIFEIIYSGAMYESKRILNLFYIPVIFYTTYLLFQEYKNNFLVTISKYSMGIYFVHPILIVFYKKFLPPQIVSNFPILVFLAMFLTTIVLCTFFCFIISKFKFSKLIITLPKKIRE